MNKKKSINVIPGSAEQYGEKRDSNKIAAYTSLGARLLIGLLSLFSFIIDRQLPEQVSTFSKFFYFIAPTLFFLLSLYFWLGAKPTPPFGFE